MQWRVPWIVAASVGGFLSMPMQAAEDAQQIVQQLYGTRISDAEATRDFEDDLILAQEMLKATQQAAGHPELILQLAEAAHRLTARDVKGIDVAQQALRMIADEAPEHHMQTRGRSVTMWQNAHRRSRGDDKSKTATGFVDALRWSAAGHSEAGQWREATVQLQQATSLARAAALESADTVRQELELAQHRQRSASQAERLRDELLLRPDDVQRARNLALVLIIDLAQPERTAPLANVLADDPLREVIVAAGADEQTLTTAQHHVLGNWYFEQSRKSAATVKPSLLRRAYTHLTRFIEQHKEKDLARTRAELALGTIRTELSSDVPAITPAAMEFLRPAWTDRVIDIGWMVQSRYQLTMKPDGATTGNYHQFKNGRWRVIGERHIQITHADGRDFLKIEFAPDLEEGKAQWVSGGAPVLVRKR